MMIDHMCSACAVGLYAECENPRPLQDDPSWFLPCAKLFVDAPVGAVKGSVGRPTLDPNQITDARSTGRKRAIQIAPILSGMLCEWSGLKHAGGGATPILGCKGNKLSPVKGGEHGLKQGDLHHGPDKNTLNNAPGTNLHRVCSVCHHRWHAANDKSYDRGGRPEAAFPFLPIEPYFLHDPLTRYTDEEYDKAEAWWETKVSQRDTYPFRPAEELVIYPEGSESDTLNIGGNPFPDSPFFEEESDNE